MSTELEFVNYYCDLPTYQTPAIAARWGAKCVARGGSRLSKWGSQQSGLDLEVEGSRLCFASTLQTAKLHMTTIGMHQGILKTRSISVCFMHRSAVFPGCTKIQLVT
ncbi:hypothetical protein BDDG_11733 [Blastomyces dermatitidis ATCC 18188]|uniref:Uncharacterized protein n=1 Tax=Ajellomyces dermatitidis (strain ATCC 18188 / CBS 674.68) TaxID=653446 RepID=A0A0J9EL22_AJEDA|nr:hypothetical protein BDDG_11733 [Blastomyces dermatitidis ATCC 18188]